MSQCPYQGDRSLVSVGRGCRHREHMVRVDLGSLLCQMAHSVYDVAGGQRGVG